ncbi:MAG: hypothetical protein WC694_01215 [Candidatus Paceibacterota bacterium]|jgi:hypothetical protein
MRFPKKNKDGRRKNGGARAGAGRPYKEQRRFMNEFFLKEIVVKEQRHGQVRRVKKKIGIIVLDSLRKQAIQGDVRSARMYFDLTMGKAREPGEKSPRYSKKLPTKALAKSGVLKNL